MNSHPPSARPNDVSRPDARGIAEEVAAVLGEPWSLDQLGHQSRDRGLLLAPNDVELLFRIDQRDTRLVLISGGYPPDPFYRSAAHEIRVAHARGAQIIGKEIVRRLLPDYLIELRAAQDRTRQHAAAMATRAALLERLQVLLPGTTAPQGHGPSHTVVSLTCPRPVWGSVRIDLSGTTATLELRSLPADLLERILTLLTAPGSD
jgi:hypothetical protein